MLVEGPAQRRGIQTHGGDAAAIQEGEGVIEQGATDTLAADGGIDQHHRDPGDRPEDAGRQRAHGDALAFGDETTIRLQLQAASPVRFDLVPAGLLLEAHPQRHVARHHEAKVDYR